jgi:hypothetical protein
MDGALMGTPFSSLPVPGLTKVTNSSWPCFFPPFLSPGRFFFGELFFVPHPHTHPGLTYLPTFRLCTLASSLPHLPTYLPTYPPIYLPSHQPIYLCTYILNLQQGNSDASQWRYCNIPSRLLRSPSCLSPYNFMTMKNNVAMTPTEGIVAKLDFFYIALYNSTNKSHMKLLQMNLISNSSHINSLM